MADSSSPLKSAEKSLDEGLGSAAASTRSPEHKSEEVHKVSEKVGQATKVETGTDILEDGVDVMGKVSETLSKTVSEDKKGGSAAQGAYSFSGMTPAQIRAHLLSNLPSEPAMKRQIEREIRKEVKYLHKKALKLMGSGSKVSYFEMSNILKKIRELKGILVMIAKASMEALKTLWLRFVHGIM